jgi:hypothetical protein
VIGAVEQLAALRAYWPEALLADEGGRSYVLIPKLTVNSGEKRQEISALLQPWSKGDGYATRLYFSTRFTSKGQNWNTFNILGRTWYACSWSGVAETLSWREIIASHLRPLQ